MSTDIRTVPLDQRHRDAGAKMVDFAGFWMPLQYSGIKHEHQAVRQKVGLFDVSHMGEVELRGEDALDAADLLFTNDIKRLDDGQAMYTAMCRADGGIVDDLVVYRLKPDHVLICLNAANRKKDVAHIREHLADFDNLVVEDTSSGWVQLALQGPRAEALMASITPTDLASISYFRARFETVAGVSDVLISRTGYTGEDGFELYIPVAGGDTVFDAILEAGGEHELELCGLGCRDTLRLEARYLLYGQDIDETTNPVEAGLSWVVKLDRDTDFVGRQAIERVKEAGPTRRLRGLVLQGRGVLRPGYEILDPETETSIGTVTSGTFAPTLDESIGLGYIDVEFANLETVDVQIRSRRSSAKLTRKPFYSRN